MSFGDFLGRVTTILERIGLEYMVVGSLASTFHGITRATQDIDLVVTLGHHQVRTLLDAFPPEHYYVSETAARDAVRRRSQFNIIDMDTGWKADLVIQKQRPFSRHEMQRRTRVTLMGHQLHVATAEDTVIAKLEWAREGQSERQFRDIAGILEVKGAALDTEYIDHWVAELGLKENWERARSATAKGKA